MRTRDRRAGVFEIVNQKSGRRYVGASANVNHALGVLVCGLRYGRCTLNRKLKSDWREHGEENFTWSVLMVFDTPDEAWAARGRALIWYAKNDSSALYNRRPHVAPYSEETIEAVTVANEDIQRRPEVRANKSSKLKRRWAGFTEDERLSRVRAAHAFWNDPERRARTVAAIKRAAAQRR